jgi:hypothetical protein
MAKNLIRQYVFAPGGAGAGTIKIPGRYNHEQILLITNTTRNTIIYNFASSDSGGTTVAFTTGDDATNFPKISQRLDGYTTITLAISTSGHSSSDRLQILVEDTENGVKIRPWAFGTDSIERMRVSNPRSMIDADFEYGLQPTKWAGYGLMRGYPSVYEYPGVDVTVSAITTDYTTTSADFSLITVTTTAAHGITAGQAVNITSLSSAITGFSRADGNFIVYDVPSGTQLRYFANGLVGTLSGQSLLTDTTLMKRGNLYTGASLNTTTASSNGANPSVITVNFGTNHGLVPGCPIYCSMAGGTNGTYATGQFIVSSVPSLTSITFTARTGGIVTPGTPTVYALSNSAVTHRPFDGGVILTCKTPSFGATTVRTSKKYFRYQSGKGLLWSTGTMFRPSYDIQSLTASATTIGATVTCKVDDIDHGLQIGASVTLSGVTTSGYNGTYTVNGITDDYTFTFLATSVLGATTAALDIASKVGVTSWHGAVVRAGCFDDQNGMFWEYTGSLLCAVRRNATQQLSGTVAINSNSNTVTGTNTRFTTQVKAGDKVVIRGMTHYVTSVASATSMTVTPDFRGVSNATGVKASLVQETRIKQSDFNIDKLDGTGPSGFTFDPGKMQMMGIQYTWYGAGFIDFMVRGSDGNWVFAHRIKNNNVNTEAHMRTGNLPVRYSIDNDGSPAGCYLTVAALAGDTTLTVNDTTYYPTAGTLYIDNELISYTGKTATTFTGCTRAATLTQWVAGSSRSFTAAAAAGHALNTGVLLVSNTCSPTLSHWGSALICDGGFDEDRGYIFNYQRVAMPISASTQTAFLIRLAPSVSNSAVGDLGSKDLLNRSQLLLNAVGVQTYGNNVGASQGSVIIEGVLNPKNFSTATWSALNFESVGGQPSLAQVATAVTWSTSTFAIPGEQVFAFSATPNSDNRLELTELKELTNSPFGGVGAYPNGPDILAINVKTAVGATSATILLRWGEAQA